MASRPFASTYPELIDRILRRRKFLPRRFLILFLVLAWCCGACWILISDQNSGRLITGDDLKFSAIKIGSLSLICAVAMLLTWVLAGKKKSG